MTEPGRVVVEDAGARAFSEPGTAIDWRTIDLSPKFNVQSARLVSSGYAELPGNNQPRKRTVAFGRRDDRDQFGAVPLEHGLHE